MGELFTFQFGCGLALGLACWFTVYAINRAWLGFWSFMR